MEYTNTSKISLTLAKADVAIKLLNREDVMSSLQVYIELNNSISQQKVNSLDDIYTLCCENFHSDCLQDADNKEQVREELIDYYYNIFNKFTDDNEIAQLYALSVLVFRFDLMQFIDISEKIALLQELNYAILDDECSLKIAILNMLLELYLSTVPYNMDKIMELNQELRRILNI